MDYFNYLRAGTKILAGIDNVVFVGQSLLYPAHAMFKTLQNEDGSLIVPMEKRIEMPVAEDFQMGFCTGLSLEGFVPVSIFPRMDFLLLAMNQLVNHLDKIPAFSNYRPRVIIRTAVGARYPINSGPQQSGDYTAALRLMLKNVEVIELNSKWDVIRGYTRAATVEHSVLLVERMDLYNE